MSRGRTCARVLDAVRSLLNAGVRTGEFRSDLDAEDVWLLLGFLWQESLTKVRAQRLIDVFMAALAAPTPKSGATRADVR